MIVRPLTEYCTLNMGQSPDSKTYNTQGKGLPFYQGNADFGETHPITHVWCSAPVKVAEDGDILISVRAPIGAMNMAVERCCIGRGLAALTPIRNKCSKQFLYYALQSKVDSLIAQGTGSTFKAISKKVLEATCIPAYSTIEQEQIAETIGHVDNTIAARRKQLALLDQLVKSRFIELFGDPASNSPKWDTGRLGDYMTTLTDFSANGSYALLDSQVVMYDEPHYAIMVRTTDLETGDLKNGVKYIDQKAYELLGKSKLFGGEMIMNKIGSAGKIYLMPHIETPASLGRNAFMFRFDQRVNIVFLYALLTSEYGTAEIQQHVRGAVTKTITKESTRSIRIIVPPIELQEQFAAFVEQTDKSKLYGKMEVAA